MSTPLYKIRFIPPTPKDRIDTLARLEIIWLPDAGDWYGSKITGIMIKNRNPSPFAPPEPFVVFPSRYGRGKRVGNPYIEPESNDQGHSTWRLREVLLGTYRAWADDQRAAHQMATRTTA